MFKVFGLQKLNLSSCILATGLLVTLRQLITCCYYKYTEGRTVWNDVKRKTES